MKRIIFLFFTTWFFNLSGMFSLIALNPPYQVHPVMFNSGDTQLAGDYLIPQSEERPIPAVVFIHGSGTADRNQSWVRMFADHLAKNGIAVLIPDKRGSGKSEGDWRTVGFEVLAQDAIAAIRFVENQQMHKTERIGLAGFSQGGHIAPLAASKYDGIDFIINVSGGVVTMEETMIHEVTYNAVEEGLDSHQIAQMLQLHGAFFDFAIHGDWTEVERLKERALDSDWKEFAQTLPLEKKLWLWEWIKKVGPYNPIPYWKKIDVPVLVVYGEKDNRDKVMVWQSVYRLSKAFSESNHSDYLIKVYPETEHGLFEPGDMYIHQEFGRLLVRWIHGNHTHIHKEQQEGDPIGYICPPCPVFPHHDTIYDKPGTCPNCGMQLQAEYERHQ